MQDCICSNSRCTAVTVCLHKVLAYDCTHYGPSAHMLKCNRQFVIGGIKYYNNKRLIEIDCSTRLLKMFEIFIAEIHLLIVEFMRTK